MTLENFVSKYRLKTVTDTCGETVVASRLYRDANLSEHDHGKLALCWITDGKKPARTGLWNRTRAACLESGMSMHQEGDAEGIFLFNPEDTKQAKLAIKVVKAKIKKTVSPERVAAMTAVLAAARAKANSNAQISA